MSKLKPLTLDGIVYTPQFIMSGLQPLDDIREVLIEQGQLPHAAAMSQLRALLVYLAENTEDGNASR